MNDIMFIHLILIKLDQTDGAQYIVPSALIVL